MAQRVLEVSLACLLLCIASPLLLLAVVVMCWDSQGSPIFRQRRMSQGGEAFWLFKIRTMYLNRDGDGDHVEDIATSLYDPRITPVGRFLRKTHLDELLQLVNVLLGDMRFIGPRPMTVKIAEARESETPRYRERLSVKPGILGLAQLCGTEELLPRRHLDQLELDLFYIQNRSLGLDLWILYATVRLLLRGQPFGPAEIGGALQMYARTSEPVQEAA